MPVRAVVRYPAPVLKAPTSSTHTITDELLDPFREANPDLELQTASFGSNEEAAAKLAGGFEADVVEVCLDEMSALTDRNLLRPLDPAGITDWDSLVFRDSEGVRDGSDVMVVPHHGSRTSSTHAFVRAVDPAIAIVGCGYRNRFGHPRADIVARYTNRGVAVVRTDLEGALTITFDGRGPLRAVSARAMRGRYWLDAPEREGEPLD